MLQVRTRVPLTFQMLFSDLYSKSEIEIADPLSIGIGQLICPLQCKLSGRCPSKSLRCFDLSEKDINFTLHVSPSWQDKNRKCRKISTTIQSVYFLPAKQYLILDDKPKVENKSLILIFIFQVSLLLHDHNLFVSISDPVIIYSVSGHYLHIQNSPWR